MKGSRMDCKCLRGGWGPGVGVANRQRIGPVQFIDLVKKWRRASLSQDFGEFL